MSLSLENKKHFGIALTILMLITFSGLLLSASAQTSVENDFMTMLNAERARLGKDPLAINSYLTTAAYLHSKDMGDNGYFSHTSLDGTTFVQRIVAAGYTSYSSLGENIALAYGSPDAAEVYNMWKNSAGHYANMIGDFNDAGLGVYSKNGYTYYTLDLGRSRTPVPQPADYACSASQSTQNINAGSSATSTITVTSLNGFSATVGLTATSFPAGWTVTLNPNSLTLTSGGFKSSTLSITVPSSSQAGTYQITVSGTSASLIHAVAITVNVQAPQPVQTVPSAPQNLRATSGNTQVALSWIMPSSNGGSPITNYNIYRRTASTSETLLAAVGNVLSYNDATVMNGQTYYYRITAVNSVGESAESNEANGTPSASSAKALNVAVSTNSPTYSRGARGIVTVKITDLATGTGLPKVRVSVTLYYPSGTTAGTAYLTTDTSGNAQVIFVLGSSAQLGTYKIEAAASQTGYSTNTGQATFKVA